MNGKVFDLTHLVDEDIPVYPGTEQPKFDKIDIDGYREMHLHLFTHVGTHIDAPYHILPDGLTLEQLPISQFIGRAFVIDCKKAGVSGITKDMITPYEALFRQNEFVLFNSGWSKKWGTQQYYEGFPTLSEDAVNWLMQFNLKGIGLDMISLDVVGSLELPNHHMVLGKGMIIIENLNDLDLLPDSGFLFQCFPLKIAHADGSPVRAVGIVNNELNN